ncbi:uncharacterized protein LOC111073485 [Drosophila obscura]|uniref:uncharacterized protein LOC111073485 n=1 Tax=Drosophila obscura TaxID=7282 RepID=UPI001BB151E4|nr:uncharacterized protein LOC111073485 [Drosophila obscura]
MDYGIESSAIIGIVLIFCAIILFYLGIGYGYKSWSQVNTLYEMPVLPRLHSLALTLGQLKRFNGKRQDGRILVAFKGKIYDVSGESEFIVGGSLNFVAGTDFSHYLNTELPLEPMERIEFVERWETLLKTIYSCVGILIDCQGNPLFIRKNRNWPSNEALEDFMEDQTILDFCNDQFQTKSVEADVENSSNNEMTHQLLNDILSAETSAPLKSLNNAAPNQLIDMDLD